MNNRGFTLVELLVSIGIFALMTALVVAKYGNFNQGVLLTNLAYDVALTLRTAQTYGLSVKSSNPNVAEFRYGYGVHFNTASGSNTVMTFFADTHSATAGVISDGKYTVGSDTIVSTYSIKRGARISGICINTAGCGTPESGFVDITFKRPDPNARMCKGTTPGVCTSNPSYVELIITGADGGTRGVTVRENGQISVKDQ